VAMGIYRAGQYSNHQTGVAPAHPVLKITVETPSGREREVLEAPIDTGFAGFLLTPADVYAKLSELELPQEYFPAYLTLAGSIIMRRAKVRMRVFGKVLDSFIETPVVSFGRLLVGRRILNSLSLAILGPDLQTCELHPAS